MSSARVIGKAQLVLLLAIQGAWLCTGCAPEQPEFGPATFGFIHWTDGPVLLVTNGYLPQSLPGFRFCDRARNEQLELREVRVADPARALEMLGKWADADDVRYAIFPIDMDDLTEERLGPGADLVLEDMLRLSAMSAKETGGVYLVVMTPEHLAVQTHSSLAEAGLIDDTSGFFRRLTESLQSLARLLGGAEAGPVADE